MFSTICSDVQGLRSHNNPFEEPQREKAFYHPTRRKNLARTKTKSISATKSPISGHKSVSAITDKPSTNETQTAITNPKSIKDNSNNNALKVKQMINSASSKMDNFGDGFLDASNTLQSVNVDGDTSSKFDESWPSSERPASVRYDATVTEMDVLREKQAEYSESVLSKYIERFRTGEPTSRDKRHRDKTDDFWWLQGQGHEEDSCGNTSVSMDKQASPQLSTPAALRRKQESLEESTRQLQDKAQQLLMESTSSWQQSERCVSTEGLGSSPSSVGSGSVRERTVRPAFTRAIHTGKAAPAYQPSTTKPTPSKPEDDILYQWRLRRKMELARNASNFDTVVKSKLLHHEQPISNLKPTTIDQNVSNLEFGFKIADFGGLQSMENYDEDMSLNIQKLKHNTSYPEKVVYSPNVLNSEVKVKGTDITRSTNVTQNRKSAHVLDYMDKTGFSGKEVSRDTQMLGSAGRCRCDVIKPCACMGNCTCYCQSRCRNTCQIRGVCSKHENDYRKCGCVDKTCDCYRLENGQYDRKSENCTEYHQMLQAEKPDETVPNRKSDKLQQCHVSNVITKDIETQGRELLDNIHDQGKFHTQQFTNDNHHNIKPVRLKHGRNDGHKHNDNSPRRKICASPVTIKGRDKNDLVKSNSASFDSSNLFGESSSASVGDSFFDTTQNNTKINSQTPVGRQNINYSRDKVIDAQLHPQVNDSYEQLKIDNGKSNENTLAIKSSKSDEIEHLYVKDGESDTPMGEGDISKVIGQVVGQLFDTTITSPSLADISDITSVSPLTSSHNPEYESDNEFAEDQLLVMLRGQRDVYRLQLRELDQQLAYQQGT